MLEIDLINHLMITNDDIDKIKVIFTTKDDLKEMKKVFVTKKDLQAFVTKKDLRAMENRMITKFNEVIDFFDDKVVDHEARLRKIETRILTLNN